MKLDLFSDNFFFLLQADDKPVEDMEDTPLAEAVEDEIAETETDKEIRTRKDRPTGSIHFGDTDFEVEDEFGDATWGEVCHTCCCHTAEEWVWLGAGILIVATLLYFFLFGLDILGTGAKVMSGCKAGELFGDDTNPIAGVMVGILATVLLQSSSTTTSIIVSLVGEGGPLSVSQAIYMVMGANIGTSVTNTIVAIGQMGDAEQLERAFAGATVHDMFNFMAVGILLPLEVITGYLDRLTSAMVKNASVKEGESWEGPVKKIVSPLGKLVIIGNKKVTKAIAADDGTSCSDFYPMNCTGSPTYKSCGGKFGLIGCDKDTNKCPAFFAEDATAKDDKVSGGVVFFISIMILFTCLLGIVAILQKLFLGLSTRIIYKATDVNGYLAMAIGCGVTMIVQSSSITTSTLTPLVGMGALRLEQMYPLTLGANIGTTLTAITAAMVSDSIDSLQVALAHLMFNLSGIAIFYPIPFMRSLPLYAARRLGKATRIWRGFPLVYIAVMFVLVPVLFLLISALFSEDAKAFTVLGTFIVIIISLILAYLTYWCLYLDGREKCTTCMAARERKRVTILELPDDMDFLKARVAALSEHTGLIVDDEEENDKGTEEEEMEVEA
jgi:sodium-dependent phosphate cotransporter